MATADPAELDARVRVAEQTLARKISRRSVEHVVTTPAGVEVRVVEFGGDGADTDARPPVVLLHGIASVTALALPLIAELPGRHIFAVDWPGHGLSGSQTLSPDADLRAHATAVLDSVTLQLELARVDIIGHSLGGQFGLIFALQRPERVRRLVLLGAPGAAFEGARPTFGMRLAALPGVGTALLGLSTSQASTRRGFVRTLGEPAVEALPPEAIEIAHLCSQRSEFAPTVASLFRAIMTPFTVRPGIVIQRGELATLAAPTLLVLGDADRILTQTAGAGSMSAVPGGSLLEVSAGHAPWLDEASVGPAVAAFLDDAS
jgi:pimeloyl-ACP methyl ester carboxylesterase